MYSFSTVCATVLEGICKDFAESMLQILLSARKSNEQLVDTVRKIYGTIPKFNGGESLPVVCAMEQAKRQDWRIRAQCCLISGAPANSPTKYASAASWIACTADVWNRRSLLNSCAILAHQALEWQPPDLTIRGRLEPTDLTQCNGTRTKPMRFLDATGLPGRLVSGALAPPA